MNATRAAGAEFSSESEEGPEVPKLTAAEPLASDRRPSLMDLALELATIRAKSPSSAKAHHKVWENKPTPGIELDHPTDTYWAHPDPRFSRVVHVMHQGWHGIRAAASFLPGHKVAVPVGRPITAQEIQEICKFCETSEARSVVFHGYAQNIDETLHFLRKWAGDDIAIYSVWHGSTAQFHHDIERKGLARLVSLKKKGWIRRIGAVKPGLNFLSDAIEAGYLLNYPPHLRAGANRPSRQFRGSALIPMPVDWRKNFYTSLYATNSVPAFRQIYVMTDFHRQREFPIEAEVIRLPFLDRSALFRLLERVDVILNTSLSECQPMVALEGLAFNIPCLTGPLSLGKLDQHPYQRRVQIAGVDSIDEVRMALLRLVGVLRSAPSEVEAEMKDYRAQHCREASERLGAFLSL